MRFSSFFNVFLTVFLALTCFTRAVPSNAVPDLRALLTSHTQTSLVSWNKNTSIFFPTDANWANETTQRWNIYMAPTYFASIRPGSWADVVQIVNLCTSFKVPFLATGGGHGYGTEFGKLQNGIELDMGFFKNVSVNAEANTMTIGGSVTFNDVLDPLYAVEKEIQTGSCSCVGMVGATLGAGVGRYQGIHGLIIDALLSATLVTAQGKIVTISATENPDLFWAFRGAGQNFGVVLQATYRIFDATNGGKAMSADFIFAPQANASFFQALASYQGRLPAEMSAIVLIAWNEQLGATVPMLNIVYVGPQAKGMELIAPFVALQPIVQQVNILPWNKLVLEAGFGLNAAACVKGQIHSFFGVSINNISAPTQQQIFTDLAQLHSQTPGARGSAIELEFFPTQAVLAVPDAATAYPWRNNIAQVMLQMQWNDSSLENKVNDVARKMRSELVATSGHPSLEVYVSYAHGDEPIENIFGASKLPLLAPIKKKWDPSNVFGYANALPTSYP